MCLITTGVVFYLFIVARFSTDASCTFPSDLRGEWMSSKKGNVSFTSTELSGYHPCKNPAFCPPSLPDRWECWEKLDDRYVLRTGTFTDSGSTGRVYTCFYLYRVSSEKYLAYQTSKALKGSPFFDYVESTSIKGPELFVSDLCDLPTNPFPATRYNLFIKSGSIDSAQVTCPTELLGNFQLSGQCDTDMDVCSDRKYIVLTNSTCTQPVFYSESGELSCLHSVAWNVTTYVTIYNHDLDVNENTTFRFVCLAVVQVDDHIQIHQSPNECSNMTSTDLSAGHFTLRVNHLCRYACNFTSSLIGSWVSNRKGQIVINGGYLSGFEPYGDSCKICSSLSTDFECYIHSGSKYLIRSARTDLAGESVRIYLCLDFTKVTSSKYIYYQAHHSKDVYLDDYLTVLNAAAAVDTMDTICANTSTYDPALFSLLLKSDSLASSASKCPSDLHAMYNSTQDTCDYTLSTCNNEKQVHLTRTACRSTASVDDVFWCVLTTSAGGTTYVTLLNSVDNTANSSNFYFSCIAYQKVGTVLGLTQVFRGCQAGQNGTNVVSGLTFSFEYVDECPTDDDFWWVIVVCVIIAVVVSGIVALFLWIFYGKQFNKRRRQEKEKRSKEIIADSDSVKEDIEEMRGKNEDIHERYSRRGDGMGGADGEKTTRENGRILEDIFTVGIEKMPQIRIVHESRLCPKKRDEDSILSQEEERKREDVDRDTITTEEDMTSEATPGAENIMNDTDSSDFSPDATREALSIDDCRRDNEIEEDVCLATGNGDVDLSSDEYSDDFSSAVSTDSVSEKSDAQERKQLGQSVNLPNVFGSKYSLHLARAWALRKNNPSLIQDDAVPRMRHEYEKQDQRNSSRSIRSGRLVSIRKILNKARWRRKRRIGQQRKQSVSENRSKGSFPAGMRELLLRRTMQKDFSTKPMEIPFHEQYRHFRQKRDEMDSEGFWDDFTAPAKTSEEEFGFRDLEEQLQVEVTVPGSDDSMKDVLDKSSSAKIKESIQPEHAGFRSLPQVTVTLVSPTQQDPRWPTLPTPQDTALAETVVGGIKDTERSDSAASSRADCMDKLYVRLKGLGDRQKEHEEGDRLSDHSVYHKKEDRKRVGTAVRRLLTERLFPADISHKSISIRTPEGRHNNDESSEDAVAETTSALNLRSRLDSVRVKSMKKESRECLDITRRYRRSKVRPDPGIEQSRGLENDTDGSRRANTQTQLLDLQTANSGKEIPSFSYPLGPVKHTNLPHLHGPALSSRTTCNPFRSFQEMRALRKGQTFLPKLKEELGTTWGTGVSVPVGLGRRTVPGRNRERTPNLAPNVWHQESHDLPWTYNVPTTNIQPSQKSTTDFLPSSSKFKLRDIDDLNLRKLLEELYRDKKYMDKVLMTTARDSTEDEVQCKLKIGRDYLLQRAQFWQEKGPLPPRPPATQLGLRLQKFHTPSTTTTHLYS